MPNQIVSNETQSILSHYETVAENLRLIDSVTCLVISSQGNIDDDAVSDAMLLIGKLMNEASHANDAILAITGGGGHE